MNILSKISNLVKCHQHTAFLGICIALISFTAYNLGKINALEKVPITVTGSKVKSLNSNANLNMNIYSATQSKDANSKLQTKVLDTRVVVSKNSNKYHHTWCASANKIKEENKIWFNSATEAEKAGYMLAGNCK